MTVIFTNRREHTSVQDLQMPVSRNHVISRVAVSSLSCQEKMIVLRIVCEQELCAGQADQYKENAISRNHSCSVHSSVRFDRPCHPA